MKTVIKLDRILNLKAALHYITTDSSDIRHIGPALDWRGTHVFNSENLNDLSAYFSEVRVVVNDNGGELILFWAEGVVENIVSAIELAIAD